ncbi:MAG TPA: hypothetical protein VH480_10785, partial [Streptosporangiaceae bacterium]
MRLPRQLPLVMRIVSVALAGPALAGVLLGGCGGPSAPSSAPAANTATGAGSPPPAPTTARTATPTR